ncbi:PH domain containing protein [Acanthamoeba castellanii str. Neff]|uniref:PH domain containing protein n=1 Tax=Acanthamoeba castellanii (strain ATCC 30010 / Neff) TaxID=1257118 RepID=L8H5M3_ACACF|nr:PH domain containing protein [Acanthamoeba castellanii str. Neff]ELR20522.1 PH domain containing protein [Acanthamoeba castellanii str. Neff]
MQNELKVFLKWYLNFGVYKLRKGKFKYGVLQLDYLHGRVGAYLHMPFEILDKVTLSEQDSRCFHIHLHDLTPVVLYSQQEEDRPTIVNELRQIINNTEFLKGSTEPPKLNDYAEIIRLGEVEKKGPVKWVTRTLVLTDNQLLCMRDTSRDAFPVNVIDICDILAVEREKDATFKVVTELRTFQFKASSTPKREKWVTKLTATVELQSELRERALEEKKKKQRKQKHDATTPSELMLPSGIPLLGRYEVHFADLHTLFGQNVQKPDNKIINLKVYYDIKYAAARNQISIVSVATGALAVDTAGDSVMHAATGLQQGEGVNGAGESEDEAGQPTGEDFRKKKSKKLRMRTKLIKSSPDLNSSLGSSDSKRRFLRKGSEKKFRKGSKFPSHSDIVLPVTRDVVSAREERDEVEPRVINDKRSWGLERKTSVVGLPRFNSESPLGAPRMLSNHRSGGSAITAMSASVPHPAPLQGGGRPTSPPPLPARPGPALPPRPPRSPRFLPQPPAAAGAAGGGASGVAADVSSVGSGEQKPSTTTSWAKYRFGEGLNNDAANKRRSRTFHYTALATMPATTDAAAGATTKIGIGGGRQRTTEQAESGHQRSEAASSATTTEDELSSHDDEEDDDEEDSDSSDEDGEIEAEVELDDEDDDDEDSDDDDDGWTGGSGGSGSEGGGGKGPSTPSPSSWRRGARRRSLDVMGGSGEYNRVSVFGKSLGMKDICILQTGGIFTKYCRNTKGTKNFKGARRQRSVCLSEDLTSILVYRHLDRSLKAKKDCRSIGLSQVVDICKGFKTPILMRHGRPGEEGLALSIYYTKPYSGDRTLDLVAATPDHLLASRRDRA